MVTVHSSQGSDFILPSQHSLKRGAGTAGSEVGDSGCYSSLPVCPTHLLRGHQPWHKACNGLMTQIPTGTFITSLGVTPTSRDLVLV